jgi:hypothetical protein
MNNFLNSHHRMMFVGRKVESYKNLVNVMNNENIFVM